MYRLFIWRGRKWFSGGQDPLGRALERMGSGPNIERGGGSVKSFQAIFLQVKKKLKELVFLADNTKAQEKFCQRYARLLLCKFISFPNSGT
jgi:hypothetical protein